MYAFCSAGPETNTSDIEKLCKKFVQLMLTNADTFGRIFFVVERSSQPAAVAQSVERRIGSAEVTGPIPVSSFVRNVGSLVFTRLPFFMCL